MDSVNSFWRNVAFFLFLLTSGICFQIAAGNSNDVTLYIIFETLSILVLISAGIFAHNNLQ